MTRQLIGGFVASLMLASFAPSAHGGLVSYYQFENNALDSVGGRNGTLRGNASFASNAPSPISSFSSTSLFLDGFEDKVTYTPQGGDALVGTFSAAMWINPSELGRVGRTLSFLGSRGPTEYGFDFKLLDQAAQRIRVDIGNGTNWLTISDTGVLPINIGIWYHVAVTVTPTNYAIYFNGSSVRSGTYGSGTPILFDSNHVLAIGANGINNGEEFHGFIDDVRIYNHALTPNEVAALASPVVVPEPSSLLLMGLGLGGIAGFAERRRLRVAFFKNE